MILANHMKFTQAQFDELLDSNQLVLAFVGMSNVGKTYWSKKLAELDFEHINCDDRIEAKLAPELTALGYSGIADVSRWMGQPYDQQYSTNQQRYLELERAVMDEVFTQVREGLERNAVIDTTGSVVHVGSDIAQLLSGHALVISIDATENMKVEMFERYIKEPKPVVFGEVFSQEEGETNLQALERCYPKLLDTRSTLYAQVADVRIPREDIRRDMTTEEFLTLLKGLL